MLQTYAENNLDDSLFSDFVGVYLLIYSKTKDFNKFGWILLSAFIVDVTSIK